MATSVRGDCAAVCLAALLLAVAWAPVAQAEHRPPVEGRLIYHLGIDGALHERPGTGPRGFVVERASEHQPVYVATSAVLREDLPIARDGSFRLTLDGRTAFFPGTHVTRVALALVDAQGNALRGEDGRPILLANASFETRQPAPTSPAHALAPGAADPLRPIVHAFLENVGGLLASGALNRSHALAFSVLCPGGYEGDNRGNTFLCDNLYADYGWGAPPMRACHERFVAYNVHRPAHPLVWSTGACDRYSAHNVTRDAARESEPALRDAGARGRDAILLAADALAPPTPDRANWSELALDVIPHPSLLVTDDAVVVPSGHRLRLAIHLVEAPVARPSAGAAYREHAVPPAVALLDAAQPYADVETGPPLPKVGAPVTRIARHEVENGTAVEGIDARLANPVPASAWQAGGDAASRLEIRTRFALPEESVVFADAFDDGDAEGWKLTGLWRVGGDCLGARSQPASLQYNRAGACDYNETDANGTPTRTRGAASALVDLREARYTATLSLAHRFDIERGGGVFDILRIDAQCHGATHRLGEWDSRHASPTEWTALRYDVSACVGDVMTLRFSFDSVDEIANRHEGWAIDDVVLTAA